MKVARKILRVVSPWYMQVAISIETLMDLRTRSIEEVTGRLQAMEDRYGQPGIDAGSSAQLLLTESKWTARPKQSDPGEGSSGGVNGGSPNGKGNRQRDKNNRHRSTGHDNTASDESVDKSKLKCYNCGIAGHFSTECRTMRRDRREEGNLTHGPDDAEPALLMAHAIENVTTKFGNIVAP